jgi:Alpha/beta hydrolase domain
MAGRRLGASLWVALALLVMSLDACSSSKKEAGSGPPPTSRSSGSATTPGLSRPRPSAAVPRVEGPLSTSGLPKLFANYDLSKVGYAESEYSISGTASAYSAASSLGENGKWNAKAASSAAYKTRLIVARPVDPRKFNGTVVVEWLNVTSGTDANVDWSFGHDEMIRTGTAYVGVSAQAVGLNAAKKSDPGRYGSLVHPGDSFSYDIYSQAGMAVRKLFPTVLGGLKPRLVIADGESQSAIRMTTYVDAVAPLTHVFDGYMIHSRAGNSAALSENPQPAVAAPAKVLIRDDLTIPVLTVASETDVLGVLHFLPARQPDSRFFRLWEIAGTSHVDSYVALQAGDDDGGSASDATQFKSLTSPTGQLSVQLSPGHPFVLNCPAPFNAGEHHYVFNAALDALIGWARTGIPPRSMPRLSVNESTNPPSFNLDSNGNVLGGIRTPAVDVPLASLSGLAAPGAPQFCVFFGQTHPFTPAKVAALYQTHQDFVRKWLAAVKKDRDAGFLLPADAAKLADVVQG